jgi:hypothetical protein
VSSEKGNSYGRRQRKNNRGKVYQKFIGSKAAKNFYKKHHKQNIMKNMNQKIPESRWRFGKETEDVIFHGRQNAEPAELGNVAVRKFFAEIKYRMAAL